MVPVHLTDEDAIRETCQRLEDQMLAFIAKRDGAAQPQPARITLMWVFRQYREREASSFQRVEPNTRRMYSQVLDQLEAVAGNVALPDINLDFLWRLYNDARWPDGKNVGRDQVTKAHNFISLLRRTMSFGVKAEIEGCARVKVILDEEQFPAPKQREVRPDYGQVEAFIKTAREHGRLSLALGTALQFECNMRQKDVIGEWRKIENGVVTSDYVLNGREWKNGLVWGLVSADSILTKKTTKTGSNVAHDLSLCPMTMELIAEMRKAKLLTGKMPVIVDEATGRPYAEHAYAREWRVIARAAGIPDEVKNMDMRAGGATAADEAGASLEDIQRSLGHADVKTTMRYIRSDALQRSRRVAKARLDARQKGGGDN